MGYYNDVTSLLYGPTRLIDAMIAKHSLTAELNVFDSWFKDYIEVNRRDDGTTVITLQLNTIKWDLMYDGWHNFIELAHDSEFNDEVAYEFVRIGEETHDIERDAGGPHNGHLYVERTIRCDI